MMIGAVTTSIAFLLSTSLPLAVAIERQHAPRLSRDALLMKREPRWTEQGNVLYKTEDDSKSVLEIGTRRLTAFEIAEAAANSAEAQTPAPTQIVLSQTTAAPSPVPVGDVVVTSPSGAPAPAAAGDAAAAPAPAAGSTDAPAAAPAAGNGNGTAADSPETTAATEPKTPGVPMGHIMGVLGGGLLAIFAPAIYVKMQQPPKAADAPAAGAEGAGGADSAKTPLAAAEGGITAEPVDAEAAPAATPTPP